jgi:hypothetical protein
MNLSESPAIPHLARGEMFIEPSTLPIILEPPVGRNLKSAARFARDISLLPQATPITSEPN